VTTNGPDAARPAAGAKPPDGEAPSRAARRTARRAVVGLALAGAALAGLAATRPWVTADLPALPTAEVAVSGRQAAPVVVALVLVAAAAVVVLVTSGRAVRLVAAVAVAAAGVGVGVAALGVLRDPAAAVRPAVTQATGVTDGAAAGDVHATPWPWVAALGGAVLAGAGLAGVAGARRWPAPGRRFEPPTGPHGGPAGPGADTAATWDALSRGEDPT
jgi:uncharacterized membrane protein (TIGR02234 family)